MWKTLGGFWANLRPLGNILPSKNAQIHCGAVGLFFFRKPHVDKLFDRHWISFDSGGELIWQHEAAGEALRCWGIEGANLIRPFSREQEQFLSAHRQELRR
jgi:hypothetical protein